MSLVFGFFNSFTSFSPFWCCRRVSAEPPVDSEPFSALVSFRMQAGENYEKTHSIWEHWLGRHVGCRETTLRRCSRRTNWTRSHWSSIADRTQVVFGDWETATLSHGSQSYRSKAWRAKFSASFYLAASCNFQKLTLEISYPVFKAEKTSQTKAGEKFRSAGDLNPWVSQRIHGWTLTPSVGRLYCSVRMYELCMRG